VYPNPASEKITIVFNSQLENPQSLTIRDYLGRLVYENNTLTSINDQSIDVSKLAKGFYLISIETNKKTFTKKIILQ
jgi:hypothetical protein